MNSPIITNYKKIYLHVDSYHWAVKDSYFSTLGKVAEQFNLRLVYGEKSDSEHGLYIKVVDRDDGHFSITDVNDSQVNIFHISDNFEPHSSKLYYDLIYSNIPTAPRFIKSLTKILKNKPRSIDLLQELYQFERAIESRDLENAEKCLNKIERKKSKPLGFDSYLKGRFSLLQRNLDDCFMYLYDAYTRAPSNPIYIYEIQSFFIFINLQESALGLCVKYVQKYPICLNVIRRGIELSISIKKISHLDFFFKSAKRGSIINKKIANIYNAGLSVYIRLLIRDGKFLHATDYCSLLAKSTLDDLYWHKLLDELIQDLPIKNWESLIGISELKPLLVRLYPLEAKLIIEFFELGAEASLESCLVLDKSNTSMEARLKKLMINIREFVNP